MSSTFMAASWSASALAPAWLLAVYAVSLQGMVIPRVRARPSRGSTLVTSFADLGVPTVLADALTASGRRSLPHPGSHPPRFARRP